MIFPIAVTLSQDASLSEIERAMKHWLDTVIVPVEQKNWRQILSLMDLVNESGWQIDFILWAKGAKVKNVPLQRFANHPCLAGWLIQEVQDLSLIAMLKATTEKGEAWSWEKPSPFVDSVISLKPEGSKWWALVSVDEIESLETKIADALLAGAEGICFYPLPSENDLISEEQMKAIGFFAVHLRLWKPLLSERTKFSESWEWKTESAHGRIWTLENGESFCLFKDLSAEVSSVLMFPFSVREGFRSYSVRFPALVRLPMQRKGEITIVKLDKLQKVNLVWFTGYQERIRKIHQYTNELAPKAMQFAVQWVSARRERLLREGTKLEAIGDNFQSMLNSAKRRQFSQGYLKACQILKSLGVLSRFNP
ncbi:MAG: hypothetical protein NZ937_07665 [Armatimonadetes bacterium]|nr:hypothetical protein [Armatimonadota bacterium]